MSDFAVDHPGEVCIVAIRVNDVITGTGFLVAENLVVTCAHVLCEEDRAVAEIHERCRISIQFLVCPKSPIDVELDPEHFSRKSESDIAFLKIKSNLPRDAKPAQFEFESDSFEGKVRSKGYLSTRPFNCQPARGSVIGKSTGNTTLPHLTLDQSNTFAKGHSGAPVFDVKTNRVIGIARMIAPPDELYRGTDKSYVIPSSVLRVLWPELFPKKDDREQVHRSAESRLSQELVLILEKDERLLVDLAKQYGFSGEVSESRQRIPEIVKKLLGSELDDAVEQLVGFEKRYLKAGESESVRNVSGVFHAVMGAILDPELVRMLRSRVAAGEFLLLLPASTRTVAALLMAGVDGRLGRFRPTVGTVRTPPSGTLEVLPPAERGIERNGRFDRESLQSALTDTLCISLQDIEDPEDVLRRMLRSSAKDHERLYLVDGLGKAKLSEETRGAITEAFPYLYIVDLQTPDADRKERHNDVFAKIMLGRFLT